ncbi:MAG TPA: hypothetical protein VLV83_14200 [Acidobacteriota bacterium]|nr:hypothetical protein [Acidobacteriota bacterium]
MKTTECHSLSESLTAYLDGELEGSELGQFEEALQESQALREEVQSHQTARRIVEESLQTLPLQETLWDGIRAEISGGFEKSATGAGRQPAPARGWLWRWASLTAVAAALLVAVFFYPSFSESPHSPMEQQYRDFVRSRQLQEQERIRSRPEWTDVEDNPFRRTSFDDLNDNPFAGE